MKNLINIIFVVTCLLALTACNFKKSERSHHEDAKETKLTIDENQSASAKKVREHAQEIDLDSIAQAVTDATTVEQLNTLLKSLEASAINADVMVNVHTNKNKIVRDTLNVYNEVIVKLAKLSPGSIELTNAFDHYEKMVLAGCDAQLANCLNFGFLKTDPVTTTVLQLMATQLDKKMDVECKVDCALLLKRYYNLLALAFDLSNGIRNQDREFLYIKHAKEYGLLFQKENPDNKEFFAKHGKIFERLVSQYKADPNDKQFAEFVKAFKPWDYSRLDLNPFPFGMQQMFAFAAKNYLYSADKKSLSSELRFSIDQSQEIADKAGQPFKKIVSELRTNKGSSGIFKSLGFDITPIDDPQFFNENFFIVDRLYRGHIGIDEAASFWQGSNQNAADLLVKVNYYTRVMFIQSLFDTNVYMAGVFGKPGMDNESLFKQVVMQSEPLTKKWNMLFLNLNNISLFVSQQLRDITKTSPKDFENVRLMIDSAKRNATFLSTYPNMFLLSFVMVNVNAPLKFNTWWGAEISVDPKSVASILLDGSVPSPWFIFGGGTTTLNRTEMIFAYYYMLNTGIFETVANLKGSQLATTFNRLSFFEQVIKKTLQDNIEALRLATQAMQKMTLADINYKDMKNICENEALNQKDYTIPMKLADLQYYSLFGNATKGVLSVIDGLYSTSGPMATFDDIRDRLEPRLAQVKAMVDILNLNVDSLEQTSEIKQIKANIKMQMDAIDSVKVNFLKTMVAQHRIVSKCMIHLTKLERERQSILFGMEIKYLESVYFEMTQLQRYTGNEKLIQAKKAFTQLHLQADENISQDTYVSSQYSLFQRLKANSASLKPKVLFDDPDKTTIDALQKVPLRVNFINPVTHQPVTKEQFISNGMTLLNAQGSVALLWMQETASIDEWKSKIAAMVGLYKLGFDADMEGDVNNTITATEIVQEVIEMARYVDVTKDERIWLGLMNLNERIPREKLTGFLFENSESDMKGILDNFYGLATDVRHTLNQATDFYRAKTDIGNFLFPPPIEVKTAIADRYKKTISRAYAMINEFNAAVNVVESSFNSQDFVITYRLENNNDSIYTPSMIAGRDSKLVDVRKKNEVSAMLKEFEKKTCHFYQLAEAQCK